MHGVLRVSVCVFSVWLLSACATGAAESDEPESPHAGDGGGGEAATGGADDGGGPGQGGVDPGSGGGTDGGMGGMGSGGAPVGGMGAGGAPATGWNNLASSPLNPRYAFGHVRDGDDWYVVGGGYDFTGHRSDAAIYDTVADNWTMIGWPAGLTARSNAGVVHTGARMVMWGGRDSVGTVGDGATYDVAQQTWSTMSSVGAPSARVHHAIAYDAAANEVIVWGGSISNDGAIYHPSSNTWSAMPVAPIVPRSSFAWAWDDTARRLYVFSGNGAGAFNYLDDGAYYDAASQTWTMLPTAPGGFAGRSLSMGAFAGGKFLFWGGQNGFFNFEANGLIYDPLSDSWSSLPVSPLTARKWSAVAVNGSEVVFMGGRGSNPGIVGDGASYDVALQTWTLLPPGGVSTRDRASAIWDGTAYVVWGGWGHIGADIAALGDGWAYVP